jgi:hypothetical protein
MTVYTHAECIQHCLDCHDECQQVLFDHCLEIGGEHADADHVRLMVDCIEICQLAADFMKRESPLHRSVCQACAQVCDACAESCEKLESPEMKHCAEVCRLCAKACREMAGAKRKAA